MSDTEEAPPPPAAQVTPPPQIYSFPSNFPVPAAMVDRGDITSKQQWQDYEVAMGLDQKSQPVRLARFRSVMGKECLQIFRNLNLGYDIVAISSALKALKHYRAYALSRNKKLNRKPFRG